MSKNDLNAYLEAVMMAVLAVLLNLIPIRGAGFDIVLGTIPITLISLRRGFAIGMLSGFIWGVLTLILGLGTVVHPVQMFLEYPLAFSFNGLAGLVASRFQQSMRSKQKKKSTLYLISGSFIGSFGRYFWHYLAGIYYWGQFAPEGWSVRFYSLVFNSGSAIVTGLLVSIILLILLKQSPQLFIPTSSTMP